MVVSEKRSDAYRDDAGRTFMDSSLPCRRRRRTADTNNSRLRYRNSLTRLFPFLQVPRGLCLPKENWTGPYTHI